MTGRYARSPDWIYKTVFDGTHAVLVPLIARDNADLTSVLVLNETAGYLWEQLSEPRTLGELATCVREGFDAELELGIEAELKTALNELVRAGALTENG